MPLMFSSCGLICLSAISVTSRNGRGDDSAICMMGVASGSNFCTTGALAVSGRSLTIRFTLSRISCAPTSPFLSSSKVITTVEAPSTDVELIVIDAADGVDGVFDALGNVGLHFLRRRAWIADRDRHRGQIDFGEQIHAQGEEREGAHRHERHNQHGGENGPFHAEFREFMHGLFSFST